MKSRFLSRYDWQTWREEEEEEEEEENGSKTKQLMTD